MPKKEIWDNVKGYEGLYLISSKGRLLSAPRNGTKKEWHIVAPHFVGGYIQYTLSKNNIKKEYKAHRLVASAFLPNRLHKPEVNHIDGNKHNNNLENLEWATSSENQLHAFYTLKKQLKSVIQIGKDGKSIKTWEAIKQASKELKISAADISKAAAGKRKSAGGFLWKLAEEVK